MKTIFQKLSCVILLFSTMHILGQTEKYEKETVATRPRLGALARASYHRRSGTRGPCGHKLAVHTSPTSQRSLRFSGVRVVNRTSRAEALGWSLGTQPALGIVLRIAAKISQ